MLPDAAGRFGNPGTDGERRYLNRELSWLDFNARVLALAEDPGRPLLERAKFLAIFSSNLDEFFQVRVSALRAQLLAGMSEPGSDGLEPLEQLRAISSAARELVTRQASVFTDDVAPAFAEEGIELVDWSDLGIDDQKQLVEIFEERVFPVLTPLAVDPAHPFPYISNLSLNLAVIVRDPVDGDRRFARVKVPPILPRFVTLPDNLRFLPLEQLIAARADALFPGMEVLAHHAFRVTRDTDYELGDESADLLEAMETVLRERTKFGRVVRLEVGADMSDGILDLLIRELQVAREDVYTIDAPLDLSGLWSVYALNRPELKDPVWTPQTQPVLGRPDAPTDFFRLMRDGDVMVHHPYDSFATSVEAFIEQAARDPNVLAIKQTIYRTSGEESGIVASLVKAAESGKQVVALVELKARFDEQANIERAQVLEEAGVHVVYGLVGLKTHCKTMLVVRQESDGIRRYCHVGTGNYNPKTAGLYEDIGILTADEEIGSDLSQLFNHLTGYSHQVQYRKILVAPDTMKPGLLARIKDEAARADGHITFKMNALLDPEIIDALYEASDAGCRIDLIVRGICSLRPGVPGLSENIRVRSILGRYLEHSRIYRFGADPATAEYIIGSADLMPRNLDRRVEALVPVSDANLRGRLAEVLEINLSDGELAWELGPDDVWRRVDRRPGTETHTALEELALARSRVDART
ncbi:MAG: RNA degradosome polyphosphate kinase [Acidimicrobiia bacterium]|nr:RNA degradosome polyphosphate kinase [Acidimicrobiia bacterium]